MHRKCSHNLSLPMVCWQSWRFWRVEHHVMLRWSSFKSSLRSVLLHRSADSFRVEADMYSSSSRQTWAFWRVFVSLGKPHSRRWQVYLTLSQRHSCDDGIHFKEIPTWMSFASLQFHPAIVPLVSTDVANVYCVRVLLCSCHDHHFNQPF